jgi:hypothetical protein
VVRSPRGCASGRQKRQLAANRRLNTGTQPQRPGRRIGRRLTKHQLMPPPAIEVHSSCSAIRDSCRCASNGWLLTRLQACGTHVP